MPSFRRCLYNSVAIILFALGGSFVLWRLLEPRLYQSSPLYPRLVLTSLVVFLSSTFIVLIWSNYFSQKRLKRYADSLADEGEKLAEKSQQLMLVLEATQTLSSELASGTLLTKIVETARNLARAQYAALAILDRQGNLESFVTEGMDDTTIEHLLKPPSGKKGLIKIVLEEKRPVRIEDLMQDPRFQDFPPEHPPMHSFLGVPVISRGKVLGNIYLTEKIGGGAFTQEDEDILEALAAGAAVALENAHLYGNIEEIARRLSTEVLRQKQYAENVLQSIADGVYTTNKDKIILSWSKGAEVITGFSSQDALGKRCQDFLEHRDDQGNFLCENSCPVTECLKKSNLIPSKHLWVNTKSGKRIAVAVSAAPIFDTTGETIGVVEVFRDITKEKEIDRMKTEFISTVSHELRTPLTSIKGSLQLLLRRLDNVNPQQKNLMEICLRNTDRLVRLINDILDISKIEAGRIKMRLELWDPAKIIDAAVSGIQAMANERGVTIATKISSSLSLVLADFDRINQVITNLLSNAIKFSPPQSKVLLEAVMREEGLELEVGVRDQGPGIAAEDIPKLFMKFQRVGDTQSVGGTGLGLAICKAIVEEHGGRIWVENLPGEGSRFVFTLPIKGNQ